MTQNAIDYYAGLLRDMREQIARKTHGSSDAHEITHLPDLADRATMETDRNLLLLLKERDLHVLKEIQHALERLENGDYGICDECGEDIDPARLKAQPTATFCTHCKSRLEKEIDYHSKNQSQVMFSFSA